MKLQQIRYLCAIVDHSLSLSAASAALNTSQSGISRFIKALEDELGTSLLVRRGKRIVGLTDVGETVVSVGRRMLHDAERLKRVTDDMVRQTTGEFIIATTHLHARYALPRTIRSFINRWPQVRLSLRQGDPVQIAAWLATGQVDISLAAAPPEPVSGLVHLRCYDLHRLILAPTRHPIIAIAKPTLAELARFPMITYDSAFRSRTLIADQFERAGLRPHIVLSATDADLMKVYVKLGFGIAIVGHIAYSASEDKGLRALDARHLFAPNTIYVGLNAERQLRGFMFDFIEEFAPHLTRTIVEKALQDG